MNLHDRRKALETAIQQSAMRLEREKQQLAAAQGQLALVDELLAEQAPPPPPAP